MLDILQSKIVVDEVMFTVGKDESLVIVTLEEAVQPLLAVTTTVYVPAVEIVFVGDVVPSFHRYVPPPDAVRVMLVVEQSNTPLLGVIDAVGAVVLEVMFVLADAVQPLLAVTITV